MFQKVDCVRIRVPDIETALEFYQQKLGLKLAWRRGSWEAGLKMQDSDTELVLVSKGLEREETDLLVESADLAADRFKQNGGRIVVPPFDIAIGRCSVVEDPLGESICNLGHEQGTAQDRRTKKCRRVNG